MRALVAYPTMVVMTLLLGIPIIVLSLFGVHIPPQSALGRAARLWSRVVLRVSGVRVIVRNAERIAHDEARVYVSNHVSWFEIFALASILPPYRFVAKKELAVLPLFARAAQEVALVFIDRQNRKAAFEAYAEVAEEIRSGINVVVFPEGTRGRSYELRPFKKGPFVLAIAAQATIVPVVSWGTREIQGKGDLAIHSGTCELTFLEPVPTAGLTYEERDDVLETVWNRMAAELERRGVRSSVDGRETSSVES